jgi:hypothetical protein
MWVRAIHKNPKEMQVVLIVTDISKSDSSPKPLLRSKSETISIEKIRPHKACKLPKKDLKWTLKVIHEDDFLMSLGFPCMKSQKVANQPYANSSDMELLTINCIKNSQPSLDNLSSMTSKKLGKIPEEDVIEIFI